MDAPLSYYMFIAHLESEVDRLGSFERALTDFRDRLPVDGYAEVKAFLERATKTPEEDCLVLRSALLDEEQYLELDGKTCNDYYKELLAVFEKK